MYIQAYRSVHSSRVLVLFLALLSVVYLAPGRLAATPERPFHEVISKAEALRVWDDFRTKVLNEDYEGAGEYIYPRYRSRYEESRLKRWYFGAGADSLVLTGFKMMENYADLRYEGSYKNGKFPFEYCLIKEAGRIYFTFRAHAMTLDWEKRETDHFIFIYDRDKRDAPYGLTYPTDLAVRLMEEHYDRYSSLLDVHTKEKIEIYIANSPEETARLFGVAEKAQGYAQPFLLVVVSTFPHSVMHEVVHVLAYLCLGRSDTQVSDFLSHGLVEYGDGNLGTYGGYQATARMKKNLEEGTFKPLREIDDYPETASLTQYLIEEYGAKKYRQLFKEATDNEHFVKSLAQIYGLSMDELEHEWIDWIKRSNTSVERMDGKTVEFRIITDQWERRTIGRYTIWCDAQQKMPSKEDVARMDKLYVNLCRKKNVEPLPHVSFYLANSKNRMAEFFPSADKCYSNGNTMADTTFVGSKLFLGDE